MSFDCYSGQRKRLPSWLKKGIMDTDKTRIVRKLLLDLNLNTVCEGAKCPNKGECYARNTATFMILGNECTRDCKFCAVGFNKNPDYDLNEPENVAIAVKELELQYVVLTSVTRDDLADGGAGHFARTVLKIKELMPGVLIEVLVPDFKGAVKSVETVLDSGVDVFNHNVETVKDLYNKARPQADYKRTLELIKYAKEYSTKVITKSGFMVGLGETDAQILELCRDLLKHKCDIVTIGQYIQPTKQSLMVEKYYTESEFTIIKEMIQPLGFKKVVAGPLVRSSYNAFDVYMNAITFELRS
ncbi:MAG: lipoyl synthase [Cyanobacteriota bacterium]